MFRVSLRELLLFVAALALAIVSLKYASTMWQSVVGLIALAATAAAVIVGIFDRGPRRAFGIGFALLAISYAIIILNGAKVDINSAIKTNIELSDMCQLPTSLLLDSLHTAVQTAGYVDQTTGKMLTPNEVNGLQTTVNGTQQTATGHPVTYVSTPDSASFMRIGHFWWALLLGLLGGRFAEFVYVRRIREQQHAPSPVATSPLPN